MASFSNRAVLRYGGIKVASNTVFGVIAPRVTVSKTAVEQSYERGGKITYILSIINETSAPKVLTLTDDLGAAGGASPLFYIDGTAAVFIDGVRAEITPTKTSSALVLTDLSVPAGAVATVAYQVRVSQCADGKITNTATITCSDLLSPIVASHTISRTEKSENGGCPPFTYSIKYST